MRWTIQRFWGFGETWCTWIFVDDGNSYWTFYCWPSYRRIAAGKFAAILWAQIRTLVRRPEVIQTVLRRRFENYWKRTILHYTWCRRRTKWDGTSMPRTYYASKRKEGSNEWVDFQEYENRPSLWRKRLSQSRSLQNWNSGRISVSRQNSFLGSNRERNWKVRDRSDAVFRTCPSTWKKVEDINPEKHHHDCFLVSKAMTRLLRHDQSVSREDDGAVLFDGVLEEIKKKKFDGAFQWSINDWISTIGYLFWRKEEGQRKVSILFES